MSLCAAIAGRRLISFDYEGHHRVVVPAAHGDHASTGNPVLRGYQIRGTSSTRSVPLWDLFRLDTMKDLLILEEVFAEDPPGYRRGDKHINVHCEL